MKNELPVGIGLMLFSAALTAVGQALWKASGLSFSQGLQSWQLYAGFFCYGMGAVVMTLAFRFGSFSVLHPILSMGYVFSIFIGVLALHESVTVQGIIGDVIIILGAVFLGISERGYRESDDGKQEEGAEA